MEAKGTLVTGESSAAMAYIKGRRGISPRQLKIVLLLGMLAVGLPVSRAVTGSWLGAAICVEFTALGFGLGLFAVQLMAGPTLRKALARRGQPYSLPMTFRLTADAVEYDLVDLTMTARWPCVTDLYATRKHWVFLVQSSAMVLPRRFFATPEAERAFIAQALAHMTDAARDRSPHATRFVAKFE